jgi:MYXO-CTERM domain-containing protein
MNRRINWIIVITSIVLATSCGGGGCGGCGMEPIPGGFPANKRNANAVQVRVTSSGLASVASDPAALLSGIAGGGGPPGVLKFNAPSSCGGTTPTCCPGGNPINPCGPIDIDLNKRTGDLPRLELKPAQGASRLDVTIRARVKTEMDIPVTVPLIGDCGVKIDTTAGSPADIQIDAPISFVQDATAGTTRVVVGTVALTNLKSEDVALTGSIGCQIASLGISFFIGILADQLTGAVQGAIQDQTCKACPTGNVDECGTFATACTDNVCMEGANCLQELGLAGRARGGAIFGAISPGTTGAIDLYEVAGGYATSNTNGLALGLLGGMQPGGTQRDRCGPMATDPGLTTIPQSNFFQGNVRPDNNQPFDVGFGVHKSQLTQFAYAGYDGGFLCLTMSSATVSQLSTDTLSLLSRSLGKLVAGNSPMAVGIRPQSPPVIKLGKNIFTDDGMGNKTLTEPLLDIKFTAMEIDFFAAIDDQYARVFTVVSDVHFPIGLQVTAMGELAPVIGNPDDAFTNLTVKNSEALTESPDELAALFPNILGLVLPQLSNGLSPIALPAIGGLQLNVTDITAVDDRDADGTGDFLAIFANLAPAAMAKPVHTVISLGDIYEPPANVGRDPKQWRTARGPSVSLDLGGDAAGLEWSTRIDDGTWSAWSTNARPTLQSKVFWLPGTHKIDVRARRIGHPETIDTTPASVSVVLGSKANPDVVRVTPFHGQPGTGGCSCDSSNNAAAALPFALVLLALFVPMRRIRRRMKRLGATVWLAALVSLPGCSCGSDPCGSAACLPGDLSTGGIGRWTSIAGDQTRVVVATYDQGLGDLVVADVTDPNKIALTAVDGIPAGITPTHDPSTYRGGVEDPGPDVGAWTSIAISNGLAKVSYQDVEAGALKYAFETKPNKWSSYVVDAGNGEEVGRYTSLTIDANGHPAIAYIALGNDDGMGHRVTELRLARAGAQDPKVNEWTTFVIASANGSCAGLCGSGEACIAGMMGETCTAVTSDCTSQCAADTEACIATACTSLIGTGLATIGSGTGLYVSLAMLPDGRLAAVYYDYLSHSLKIAVESGVDTNTFAETELDGGTIGDRGLWASAVVDGSGTVHIAYQDAIGDQLMYMTWNGTPGAVELVDDGQRAGDRTHSVGAATAIYLLNGAPVIAYQDGLTADVYVATKSGATWTTTNASPGLLLDGFSIAATTAHNGTPYLAWDRLDPAQSPPNGLFVKSP